MKGRNEGLPYSNYFAGTVDFLTNIGATNFWWIAIAISPPNTIIANFFPFSAVNMLFQFFNLYLNSSKIARLFT